LPEGPDVATLSPSAADAFDGVDGHEGSEVLNLQTEIPRGGIFEGCQWGN
jgi:hypothetical protein